MDVPTELKTTVCPVAGSADVRTDSHSDFNNHNSFIDKFPSIIGTAKLFSWEGKANQTSL